MKNLWKNVSFVLIAMLVGSLLTGVIMALPHPLQSGAVAQESGRTPVLNQQNLEHAQSLSTAFRNVAEAIRPSVVSISTRTKIVAQGVRRLPLGFGVPQEREESGMGSGVIVRPDGYILTNNHVVEHADELTVELFDGRKVLGKIVGTDPQTDLAVVKIDLPGLRPRRWEAPTKFRSEIGCWRSATRSGSTKRSPPGSSAERTGIKESLTAETVSRIFYKPMPPSIRATPVARS